MGNDNNNDYDNDNDNDNDHGNWISDISKINDARGGAAHGFSKMGGSFRFTHKDTFSPKYYKSGWGGGSKAHIKTYTSANIGNTVSKAATPVGLAISGYNIYNGYKERWIQMGRQF